MFVVEAILIALALCVDSLVVSTTSSFKSKMAFRRGVLMAVTFAFFQALFPLLGALLGSAFKDVVSAVDHWIAFGLLLAVGGKMIWDALFAKEDDKVLDVTNFGTMCVLGIATSIGQHRGTDPLHRGGDWGCHVPCVADGLVLRQTQCAGAGEDCRRGGGHCADRPWGLYLAGAYCAWIGSW